MSTRHVAAGDHIRNSITACSSQEAVADRQLHVISFEQRGLRELDATAGVMMGCLLSVKILEFDWAVESSLFWFG